MSLSGISGIAQNYFIAHRGASYLAPENTVASAKLAWELGADAVEIDIHLSKDNRIMVIHDKDTKRTCNGKKNLIIKNTPSVLLRDQDAGTKKDKKYKGEKIPFLSEIIETIPEGKTLVVEIKCSNEVFPALERCVNKSGKAAQIVFIAFNWETILEAQKRFPQNKCYWLSNSKSGVKKRIEQASENGLAGINLKYSIIDKEIVSWAKENQLEVLAWTVDDPKIAESLIKDGVSKITTNRPNWLKSQLKGK